MDVEEPKPPEPIHFQRSYAGTEDQVRQVRKDLQPVFDGCPLADDFILFASELVTNAILHSRSGLPGGVFTVRAEVGPGHFARLEVEDQGGPWIEQERDEEHGRGLAIVKALAGEGNWAVEAGEEPGARLVWVRLDWDGPCAGTPLPLPQARLEDAQRSDAEIIAARCACGFSELADEEIIDHLNLVFEPDDLKGNDELAHEERDRLTCACGLSAITSDELDEHFLKAFTPDDAIGRDGRRHEQPGASNDG